MSKFVLSRRSILRGVLGGIVASVSLPPLDAMFDANGTAHADGTPIDKIFGTWFFGNGIKMDQFHPVSTGANFTPSDALQALLDNDPALKAHLSTVSNATLRWNIENVHHSPVGGILSASNFGALGSIDHVIATRWQARANPSDIGQLVLRSAGEQSDKYNIGTSFPPGAKSLEDYYHRRKTCEFDAAALFKRIFGMSTPGGATEPDAVTLARADVLDIVKDDINALKGKLGADDAQRLDAHFTNVSELQKSLRAAPTAIPAGFTVNPYLKASGQVNEVEKNGKELNRVLALALATGKTRVFSMTWSGPQNNAIFKDAGVDLENHKMTHEIKSIPKAQRPVLQHKIVRLSMSHLGHLAKQLLGYKVGGGTLLDHCAIFATSELGNACDQHSSRDTPLVLVGKAGGKLKGNYHHRAVSGDDNACKMLLTILQALGESDTSYGTNSGGSEGLVTSPFTPLGLISGAIWEIASLAMRAIVDDRFTRNRRDHPIRAVRINGSAQFRTALRLQFMKRERRAAKTLLEHRRNSQVKKMFSVLGACVAMASFSMIGCAADSDDEDVGSSEAAAVYYPAAPQQFSQEGWLDNTAQRARTQCRFTRDENGQYSGPYGLVGFHVDVVSGAIVNVQALGTLSGTALGRCIELSVKDMRVPKSAPNFGRDKRFTIDAPGKG